MVDNGTKRCYTIKTGKAIPHPATHTEIEMTIKEQRQAVYRKLFNGEPLTKEEQELLNNSFYWVNESRKHTQH